MVLSPSVSALEWREEMRRKAAHLRLSAGALDEVLRRETAQIGYWLDCSTQTTEETVEDILANLQRLRSRLTPLKYSGAPFRLTVAVSALSKSERFRFPPGPGATPVTPGKDGSEFDAMTEINSSGALEQHVLLSDPAYDALTRFDWSTDATGLHTACCLLRLRPADMIKFGELYPWSTR